MFEDYDSYTLAKIYFDMKEFERAASFLENCSSKKADFLCMYSKYLAGEKKSQDEITESGGNSASSEITVPYTHTTPKRTHRDLIIHHI